MVSPVRTRILDAAVRLLVEHGGNALTQPKIAAAAGVRQSHLTYYFPKRNDLLLAVTLHWAETHLKGGTQQAGGGPGTLQEAVRFISDAVVEAARVRIILSLIVTADQDPRIREPLRELIESERGTLASLMQRVGKPLDSEGAAILHASIVGLAVLRVARGNSADRETRALVKRVFDDLVPAMAKAAGRRASRRTGKKNR